MKPTIGRIVIYTVDVQTKKQYPAVITHVFNETCVNLHVFGDGSHRRDDFKITSVIMGDEPNQWSWPVIADRPQRSEVPVVSSAEDKLIHVREVFEGQLQAAVVAGTPQFQDHLRWTLDQLKAMGV